MAALPPFRLDLSVWTLRGDPTTPSMAGTDANRDGASFGREGAHR
jgi:hypothetical protein